MQNLRGCEKIQIIRFGESNKEKIETKKKKKKLSLAQSEIFFCIFLFSLVWSGLVCFDAIV